MNEDEAFLTQFLDEEIYVIDDVIATQKSPINNDVKVETEPITKNEVIQKKVGEPTPSYEAHKSAQEVKEVVKSTAELVFKGQNTKGVLLLVNNISSEENAFLEKVLGAVKLTLNDCALINIAQNNSPEHIALIDVFDCKIILNLGIKQLPFLHGMNSYKINFVADKKALQTDDLKSIMSDVAKKKQLWECLQKLFL